MAQASREALGVRLGDLDPLALVEEVPHSAAEQWPVNGRINVERGGILYALRIHSDEIPAGRSQGREIGLENLFTGHALVVVRDQRKIISIDGPII